MTKQWILLLLLMNGIISPAYSASPILPETLTIQCAGFGQSRRLCEGLWVALRPRAVRESPAQQLQRARRWAGQAAVQQRARAVSRAVGRARLSGRRALDLGLAQLLAGRIGEGMHHLLTAYQRAPKAGTTADAVYLGFLLSMDQLNPDQQIDWAADLASRFSAHWRLPLRAAAPLPRPPRALDIARAIHLAELAQDVDAMRQFVRFGQAYYPHDATWASIANTLPPRHTASAQRDDTPRGDR